MKTWVKEISELCIGKPDSLYCWLKPDNGDKLRICLFWIVVGSSVYGATIGIWRSPLQAGYVAVKSPLLILLTTMGNALINGMLAQLLSSKMTFRHAFTSIIISFAIASIILLSVSPVSFFLVFSAPAMGTDGMRLAHDLIILFDVVIIAFAGTVANLHLFRLLLYITESKHESYLILFSWLGVNLLLGAQLSWIMRPFIGSPDGPVEFFRTGALNGNFFEAVYEIIINL